MTRQLHLNAFLMGTGHHEASWRLPESDPVATTSVQHFQRLAQIAERGTFDSLVSSRQRPLRTTLPTTSRDGSLPSTT